MNVGQLLKIAKDTTLKLEAMGLLNADGTFSSPTPEQDAELASFVISQLTKYGVDVPNQVTKIAELLPVILAIRG